MKTNSKRFAYCLVLFGAILSASGPSAFMKLIESFDLEYGVALFILIGGVASVLTQIYRQNFTGELACQFSWSVLWKTVIVATTFPVYFVFFTYAMQARTITETGILVRVGPVLEIILAVLILKDKIRNWWYLLGAVCMCFLGIAVFLEIDPRSLANVSGVFLVLGTLTALIGAIRTILLNYAVQQNAPAEDGAFRPLMVGLSMIFGGVRLVR